MVPINLIEVLKSFPLGTSLEVYEGKVLIEMSRLVENNTELNKIFEILIQISEKKITANEEKVYDDFETHCIKILQTVLSAISSNKVGDISLFTPEFVTKFIKKVKDFTEPNSSINVTMSTSPKIKVFDKKQFWKVTITDNFTVKTQPYDENAEKNDYELNKWDLIIDKNTKKLTGIDEDLWGEFSISSH